MVLTSVWVVSGNNSAQGDGDKNVVTLLSGFFVRSSAVTRGGTMKMLEVGKIRVHVHRFDDHATYFWSVRNRVPPFRVTYLLGLRHRRWEDLSFC
jgi:hypothetical protein